MTSKFGAQSKIIIPAFRNPHHSYVPMHQQKDFYEEKKVAEPRIFIAPKHDSHPFALTLKSSNSLANRFTKSTPQFQNFDLSQFFSNKLLNQKQAAAFSTLKDDEDKIYQTPVRESYRDASLGNFKILDTHLNFTADSIKNQKAIAQSKKSRPKEKGLKKLSMRGYQIVVKMKSVLYKEVANKLIDQLNQQQQLDQEGKDQQNIKRRVYDALNVLIALGVLRKEGRRIVSDHKNVKSVEKAKVKELSQQVKKKQSQLQLKKKKLKELQNTYNLYKQLAQNHQGKIQETQVIKFPFLALCYNSEPKFTGIAEQSECQRLNVVWNKSQKDCSYFDIDLLSKSQKIRESKQKF